MRTLVLILLCAGVAAREPIPDVRIDLSPQETRAFMSQWRMSGIGVTEDGHLLVPGTPELLDLLKSLEVPHTVLWESAVRREMERQRWLDVPSQYFNPDTLETWLTGLVTAHPDTSRLIQVGTSVLGRPIWAIKVTDNPDLEEFEPELRLIGNIHGDEKSSLMVCADVLEWILTQDGVDPLATQLVSGTELWFMPMVNPDGNASHRRQNNNFVDLNRNFDGPEGHDLIFGGSEPFSEPETQAVRALSQDFGNAFMLGISFHSGVACFNSPWNHSDTAPFPDLPNVFSTRIGGSPCFNPSGQCAIPAADGLAEAYDHGCTYSGFWYVYGADWYETLGDTNDWSYYFEGTLDFTIEVTETKTPPEDQIDLFTQAHRQGVLFTLAKAFQGIEGMVTHRFTGLPLAAEITVDAFPNPVRTDAQLGDYHRFCVPGTYALTVAAAGYEERTQTPVTVIADAMTRVDVALAPEGTYESMQESWPGMGPHDFNGNHRVDIMDLVSLL